MKKNGFTLIELLASLAIMGLVLGLIFSIFSSGIKQGDKTKNVVYMQQDANYVASLLRNKYLNLNNSSFSLRVSNNTIVLDGTTVSDKYQYEIKIEGISKTGETVTIQNSSSSSYNIEIKFIDNDHSYYTLRTSLSRGV